MKSSIKFLAFIALFLTFNFAATAQRGGGGSADPAQMAEKETTQMVEKLALDNAQADKVKAINLTYAKKNQEARETYKDNRDAMKKIGTAIQKEKSGEMKMVLSEKQFKKYEEMEAEQDNRTKGDRGKRGGGRGRGK